MVARALRAETVDDDSSEAWARASTYLAAGHFSSLGDRDGCKSIDGYEYFLVALGRRTASGLCLPRACAPDDLRRFLDGARFALDDPELPAGPAYVSDDRFKFRLDELGVVVVVATAALALLAAAATYLHAVAKRDVFRRGGDPEAARDALPAWLLAFSAVENVGALLRPRGPGALRAFDVAWRDLRLVDDGGAVRLDAARGAVARGRLHGVLAAEAATASLFLRALAGRSDCRRAGYLAVDGDGSRAAAKLGARVALVSEASFRPPLTVFETVAFAAALRADAAADARTVAARRDAAIKRAALAGLEAALVGGGLPCGLYVDGLAPAERRRLAVACGLAGAPDGICVDEPPAPLSLAESLRDCALLAALARENGLAVVAASGRPAAAAWALLDDASVLSCGRLLYCGPRAGAAPWFAGLGYAVGAAGEDLLALVAVDGDKGGLFGAGDTMRGPADVARAADAYAAAARGAPGKAGDDPGDDRGGDDAPVRARVALVRRALLLRLRDPSRGALRGAVNVAAAAVLGGLARRDVAGAPEASALWVAAVALGALAAAPGLADDHRGFALERGDGRAYGPGAHAAATLAAEGALVVAVHAPAAYLFASLARLPRPADFACAATAAASVHGVVAVLTAAVAPDAGLAALLLALKFGASFAAVALSDETWITHFSTFKLADDALAASQGFSENHAAKFLALSTGLLCLLAPSTVDSALGGGRR